MARTGKIICTVCPHGCALAEGQTGICGTRKNTGGMIVSLIYGVVSGLSPDPVEKKPFYHFFPGKRILSAGSYGCNMKCDFCQNWHISQGDPEPSSGKKMPHELVSEIKRVSDNIGIAFTYNEPVIWYEYVLEVAGMAKSEGYHTAMVTNGFVTREVLSEYLDCIDAFNVDLKSFSDDFYRKITGSAIEPVKAALKQIAGAGKHLEITNLVIPGLNDTVSEAAMMGKWIEDELGRGTPLHLSRYFPMYRRETHPTPLDKLLELRNIYLEYLDYVYIGNTGSEEVRSTICPGCKAIITTRTGYRVSHLNTNDGKCARCGRTVYRYFTF